MKKRKYKNHQREIKRAKVAYNFSMQRGNNKIQEKIL